MFDSIDLPGTPLPVGAQDLHSLRLDIDCQKLPGTMLS